MEVTIEIKLQAYEYTRAGLGWWHNVFGRTFIWANVGKRNCTIETQMMGYYHKHPHTKNLIHYIYGYYNSNFLELLYKLSNKSKLLVFIMVKIPKITKNDLRNLPTLVLMLDVELCIFPTQ